MRCLGLALVLACSGCFSMVHGTKDGVRCYSNPPGARVEFAGQSGITPCVLAIRRDDAPQMARFTRRGRGTVTQDIEPKIGHRVGVYGFCVLADVALIAPYLVQGIMGLYHGWPREIHATLPKLGKGTALVHLEW